MSKEGIRNWWGTAWVEKIEKLAEPMRFAAGDKYARTGKVEKLIFEGRTITARVEGSGEPPFTVRITVDPFSPEQWAMLFAELRDRAALAKHLVSGDLPFEINTAYSKAGLRFMPERYKDLHIECPCADWLKPCKHLVAAWMKFARDFDRDPFLVFGLRGLKRDDLLASLANWQVSAIAEPEEEEEELPEAVVAAVPEALPSDPRVFWTAPPLPVSISESAERSPLDDDVFEKLRDWTKVESQFGQIYDAVYELATRIRR